jgi:hypothetical protein
MLFGGGFGYNGGSFYSTTEELSMFSKTSSGIDKNYISPIDLALQKFNETHPLSASQKAEVAKNERIAYLRDHPVAEEVKEPRDLWKF